MSSTRWLAPSPDITPGGSPGALCDSTLFQQYMIAVYQPPSVESMPGCYRITNNATGHFYIGSSTSPQNRLTHHRNALDGEYHKNKKFQTVFVGWEHITIEIFDTDTVEEARILEQQMLDQFVGTPLCCNQATSVSDPGEGVITLEMRQYSISRAQAHNRGRKYSDTHRKNMSLAHKGSTRSEETKAAISLSKSRAVEIDGIRYSSVAEASATLGINSNTIRTRLRNPDNVNYRFVD